MKIGVSAIHLGTDTPADAGYTGTEIIWRLCRLHPEHTFLLFFDGPVPAHLALPANATAVIVPLKSPALWRRKWWLQWQLPKALKKHQPDVFLALDGILPLRSRIPAILYLKDLSFLQAVAGVPAKWQQFLQRQMPKYIAHAKKVAVPGARLEQELLQYAPAAAGKTMVLPAGLYENYGPLAWEEREAVKKQYTGGMEYFIVTASMHPRNNIQPLLKAFSALKRRQRSNMKLVLAGNATPAGQEIADSLKTYKFRDDLVWIAHADQATLARLTAAAYGLVYTTRLDAIALPVYAALRCEVPVIAIDSAAAREAGQEAALYTDPENLADLADKLMLLYKDEQLRSRLLRNIAAVQLPGNWDAAAAEWYQALL